QLDLRLRRVDYDDHRRRQLRSGRRPVPRLVFRADLEQVASVSGRLVREPLPERIRAPDRTPGLPLVPGGEEQNALRTLALADADLEGNLKIGPARVHDGGVPGGQRLSRAGRAELLPQRLDLPAEFVDPLLHLFGRTLLVRGGRRVLFRRAAL